MYYMNPSNQWTQLSTPLIQMVVIPLLPVITGFIIAWLKKKTAEFQHTIQSKELSKYLSMAENAVITAVTAVNQVYVDALKKENGILSPEEQKTAFAMARNKVLTILGETGIEAAKTAIADFDAWLESKIEFYVTYAKIDPVSPAMRILHI